MSQAKYQRDISFPYIFLSFEMVFLPLDFMQTRSYNTMNIMRPYETFSASNQETVVYYETLMHMYHA